MKEYLHNFQQLTIICLLWLFTGIFVGSAAALAVIPLMLLLMYSKQMHLEILIGFFFILILSDSRLYQLSFAASVKNIYILVIALISYKEMRRMEYQIPIFKQFIWFFLVAIICIFFSPTVSLSIQKTLSYFLLLAFIPSYFLFVYIEYGKLLFKGLVFLGTLILIIGLLFIFLNPSVVTLAGRYRGLLGNPNGLGLFSYLFIILFATLNEHHPNVFSKKERIFIYVIALLSLLRCGARTSLVSILMFFFFKKFYKTSPILGFFIFVVTAIVYQLISDNLVEIISSIGLAEELRVDSLENGSGRLVAWQFAWQKIQENFYFGRGFNFTEYIYRLNYEYLSKLGHEGMAHNSFLTFWLDTGLIGLVCYLFALLSVFLKAAKKSKLAIPFLYTVLFSNYYESWLTASLNPFTIQFLFILSIILLPFIDAENPIDEETKKISLTIE